MYQYYRSFVCTLAAKVVGQPHKPLVLYDHMAIQFKGGLGSSGYIIIVSDVCAGMMDYGLRYWDHRLVWVVLGQTI